MIHIDIVSDTVCPWCYIGKRRLEKALSLRPNIAFHLGWRPFQLNPDMPRDGMTRDQYLSVKFGGPSRAQRVYEHVGAAGLDEGLEFNFNAIARQPNTFDSHRLIRWASAAHVQDRVVEALFAGYFMRGKDIGERSVLIEIAGDCGMDRDLVKHLFERDADRDLVMAEEGVSRRMGIAGVPCFIVDRKYAVSGAQDASVLTQVFDLALKDQSGAPIPLEAVQAAEEAAGV